jgi:hypothetical protein
MRRLAWSVVWLVSRTSRVSPPHQHRTLTGLVTIAARMQIGGHQL